MKYKTITDGNADEIQKKYGVGTLAAKVIAARQCTESQINQLLRSDYELTECHAEVLEQAAKRLNQAKERQEKVLIAGDYDADGLCATTIMKETLDIMGIESGFYIPNRFQEGYGLSSNTVKLAKEKGYSLIVTVDNGVKAEDALQLAKELKIEIMVTDHHLRSETVNCDILVHPDLLPEGFQTLCGAGVALQISRTCIGNHDKHIMLAAIATVGDLMPLWDENRILVRKGLELLNQRNFTAIEALLDRETDRIDEKTIGFQIVPKLNVAGRLADRCNPNNLVRYLLSDKKADILVMAAQIKELNKERRSLSDKMSRTAMKLLKEDELFHVIADDQFHEGLAGLVAGKIMNETQRPALVFAPNQKHYKGSARSVPGLDIHAFFEDFEDILVAFGGHAQAAGLEIRKQDLDVFMERVKKKMEECQFSFSESVTETIAVQAKQLSLEAIREYMALAPFGQGFPSVLFDVTDFEVTDFTTVGKSSYPKWQCFQGEAFEAISFQSCTEPALFAKPKHFIGTLTVNCFRGKEKVSVQVESL